MDRIIIDGKEFSPCLTEIDISGKTVFNENMHQVIFNLNDGAEIEIYCNDENLMKIQGWLLNA